MKNTDLIPVNTTEEYIMNYETMTTDELQNLFNELRGSGNYHIVEVLQELRKREKDEKQNTKKQSS